MSNSSNFILNTSTLWVPIVNANGQHIFLPFFYIPTANNTEILPISSHVQWFSKTPNMTENELSQEIMNRKNELVMDVQKIGQLEQPSHLFVLFLIIFGLMGNSLTAGVLFFTDLIRSNANKYILIIVLADSAYLFCAFMDLANMRTGSFWICAFIEWTANSAIFVSSICIVLLTIERFLAIVAPMEHFQMANVNRWFIILICVSPFPIWQFVLMLETTADMANYKWDRMVHRCAYLAQIPFAGLGSLVSNIFHHILPLICVLFLNAVIAFKVCNAKTVDFLTGYIAQPKPIEMSERNVQQPKARPTIYDQKSKRNSSVKFPAAEQNAGESEREQRPTSTRGISTVQVENMRRNSSTGTVASVLSATPANSPSNAMPTVIFLIPMVFVLLNTPLYTIRFIEDGLKDIYGFDYELPLMLVWIVNCIFLANCASNSIVYAMASSIFRRKLTQIMRQSGRNLSSNSQGLSITETGRRRSQNSYSMKY